MRVAVFGDSHAEALFAAFPSVHIYWIGPVTMHRIGRDGIASMLTPRWGFSRFRRHILRRYDHVLLSFGEIDSREHIERIARKKAIDIEVVVDDLTERYLDAVEDYFGVSKVPVILCVPPVTPYANTTEQKDLRDRVNALLAMKCESRGISFLDYYKAAPLDDRRIADGHHDGNVHFDPAATGFLARYLEAITSHAVAHDPSYRKQPDRLQRHRTVRARLKQALLRPFM
tara:strand:- start:258 stop:944 length:687 start_codon:yes stop_codon:yes gene_type:complete